MTNSGWPDRMEELRRRFEADLAAALPRPGSVAGPLPEAMGYACAAGKRVRPLLCLASAAAAGGSYGPALPAALALEMVHCYSLAHDDLPALDDDAERRGRPTLHVRYGEAEAILAGDALLAEAFYVLASPAPATRAGWSPVPPGTLARQVLELAGACSWRGMVGGQAEELALPVSAGVEGARRVVTRKTGALFLAACRLGALAAGASEELLGAVTRYAGSFGYAYQVIDDLHDWQRDARRGRQLNLAALLGEPAARDLALGRLAEAEQVLGATAWPGQPALLAEALDSARQSVAGPGWGR